MIKNPYSVAVSIVVTSVLVSVISVLISSLVVYLVMKRKYTSNGRKTKESNNEAMTQYDLSNVAADNTTAIYDLPSFADDRDEMIQHNAAYGVNMT